MLAETQSGNRRLLILDDDPEVNQTICAIARRAGFKTFSTTEPEQFFQTIASWTPTHLVLDLVMPNADGVEIIKQLGRHAISCQLIIVSGLGGRVLEAAAKTATENGLNVSGVLPKPFSSARLRSLLSLHPQSRTELPPALDSIAHPGDRAELNFRSVNEALEADDFSVCFQPKVACRNGAAMGFETLVRWQHPRNGLIMPEDFIPIAEQSGQIDNLTRCIVSKSLAWFAASFLDTHLQIAINISGRTFSTPEFPGWIVAECERYGVTPGQVVLEVTETTSMRDPVKTLEILTQFRIKGFSLSIDDFGVGYSSLVQLARFPFSEMKIEKMFVISARESAESQKIAAAVVGLGKALSMHVTAEGVEDEWTLDFLREIGCDFAQGYYFSRPMSGEMALEWYADNRHLHPSDSLL